MAKRPVNPNDDTEAEDLIGGGAHTSDGKPRPNTSLDPDAQYNETASELRQFVEQYEHLESEKKDIAEQQKEVMAEAKARGYDTKVLRRVLAERKRDPEDVAEEAAVFEMYKAALGMA